MTTAAKPKIVVLGGGFGGLESAFYLRWKLKDRADMTLISDQPNFLFKPNTIYIPFGLDPDKLMFGLDKPTAKKDIEFINKAVVSIDPEVKKVELADGSSVGYDYLIVSTGAGMRASEIEGLSEHALTIWTPKQMQELGAGYDKVLADAKSGKSSEVLFLVPPNNKCSGPLYEMVQMFETWTRKHKIEDKVNVSWSTFEKGYIQAFGPKLNTAVEGEFDKRGIAGYREHVVTKVHADKVDYANGASLPYDLLVSFPPYIAGTTFEGLPVDDRGFISTNLETRQVNGYPEIYAVGDIGDFPVKQAFLAFLQADAAADHLATRLMGTQPTALFEPTSMCVMEQFDKATFAQVPLRLTGDPASPVAIRDEDEYLYKMGSNKAWRLGKKLLGFYLPWRFKAGEPFHAGAPWKGMEVGLKIMSKIMAA